MTSTSICTDEVTKRFIYKTGEEKSDILFSVSDRFPHQQLDNSAIQITFPDAYALYGWAQVFKKWFGYIPEEVAA